MLTRTAEGRKEGRAYSLSVPRDTNPRASQHLRGVFGSARTRRFLLDSSLQARDVCRLEKAEGLGKPP